MNKIVFKKSGSTAVVQKDNVQQPVRVQQPQLPKARIKSKPRLRMIEFVKTEMGGFYTFELHGFTIDRAGKFVHNMRVEFSRLKKEVREKHNKIVKHFKMNLISITEFEEIVTVGGKKTRIVSSRVKLQKSKTAYTEIQTEIDEAISAIAGGDKL